GVKFDVGSTSKTTSDTIGGSPFSVKYRNTTFMGGLQFKNNMKDGPTVKPFAHVLAGAARQTFTSADFDDELDDTSFSMMFGGGIDIRASKHVDIRVIQVDYNPVFRSSETFTVDPGPPPT